MLKTLEDRLLDALADGRATLQDVDEVRNFAGFLEACGPAPASPGFDRDRFSKACREHYPEEYERALLEEDLRRGRVCPWHPSSPESRSRRTTP